MKKLLLLFAAIFMTLMAYAQDYEDSGIVDKRTSAVHFGIKAGANISTMSKFELVDLGQKSGFGFEGGVVLSARFGKRTKSSDPGTGVFGIQIEPTYVQRTIGTKYDDLKLSYFDVPVLLKFFVTPNLNLEVGPNFSGSLSSSPDYIEAPNTRISTGDLKGFDLKICVGVSYETKQGFFASLRYNLGTSDLDDNFPCKVSTASLTLGYKFNIFKF